MKSPHAVFLNSNIIASTSVVALIFSLSACITQRPENTQPQLTDHIVVENKLDGTKRDVSVGDLILNLQNRVTSLEADNTQSKSLIASLKVDLQSQKEEMQTQKKNIAILKRGLRSGIFEEFPDDNPLNNLKDTSQTMLPDLSGGKSGFIDGKSPYINSDGRKIEAGNQAISASQLLANAEIKINFGRG